MSGKQFVEYRWGTRYKFGTPAELTARDVVPGTATIRDASLSGAFVETSSKFPLFARISVRSLTRPSEWLEASVVRADDGGIAVRWLEPGLRPISALLPPRPRNTLGLPAEARRV